MTAHPVIAAPPATVMVTIGLKTVTEGNAKWGWKGPHFRAAHQVREVKKVLPMHLLAAGMRPPITKPVVVTVTRVAPSKGLDAHDNLPGSQKHVVDGIAACLGVDDADPLVEWRYAQRQSKRTEVGTALGYAVRIEICSRA